MKSIFKIFILSFIVIFLFASCDKTKEYDLITPPDQAHFMNQTTGVYQILTANSSFKIPIGVTKASGQDRKVTISVSSPTGAVSGTHYTITNATPTIKAGAVIDSIEIKGVYAQYLSGRKDTLIIKISTPDINPSDYNSVYKLVLRGPCFEGDVVPSAMIATYAKTFENFGSGSTYGPYTTKISAATLTSPTTALITVTNIWDNGWGPLQFVLDWTNPAARTATVVPQAAIPGSNAGDLNSAYAGQTIAVRPFTTPTAANTGTFSACSSTFTLRMQLGVTGVGYFSSIYEVRMAR